MAQLAQNGFWARARSFHRMGPDHLSRISTRRGRKPVEHSLCRSLQIRRHHWRQPVAKEQWRKTSRPKPSCRRLGCSKVGISSIRQPSMRYSTKRSMNTKVSSAWRAASRQKASLTGNRQASPTRHISGRGVPPSGTLSGGEGNIGVDLHIAARGDGGSFDNSKRDPAAHELVLLREGDDRFDAGAGDDVGLCWRRMTTRWWVARDSTGSMVARATILLVAALAQTRLKGDAGDDTMTGGEGADHFVFAAYGTDNSGFSGHDTITDFDVTEDRLLITGGYRVADLLNGESPRVTGDGGGLTACGLTYADKAQARAGRVKRIARDQLTPGNFHILQSDRTVAFGAPAAQVCRAHLQDDDLTGTAGDEPDRRRTRRRQDGGRRWQRYLCGRCNPATR